MYRRDFKVQKVTWYYYILMTIFTNVGLLFTLSRLQLQYNLSRKQWLESNRIAEADSSSEKKLRNGEHRPLSKTALWQRSRRHKKTETPKNSHFHWACVLGICTVMHMCISISVQSREERRRRVQRFFHWRNLFADVCWAATHGQ